MRYVSFGHRRQSAPPNARSSAARAATPRWYNLERRERSGPRRLQLLSWAMVVAISQMTLCPSMRFETC